MVSVNCHKPLVPLRFVEIGSQVPEPNAVVRPTRLEEFVALAQLRLRLPSDPSLHLTIQGTEGNTATWATLLVTHP